MCERSGVTVEKDLDVLYLSAEDVVHPPSNTSVFKQNKGSKRKTGL